MIKFILIVSLLFRVLVSNLFATWTHIYVDIAASDTTGDGSKFNPLKYISQIGQNELITDSSVVHIRAGVYDEYQYSLEASTQFVIAGTSKSYVQVVADGGRPYIYYSNATIAHRFLQGVSNLTLKGLRFGHFQIGETITNCSNINIIECVFHGTRWTFYNVYGNISFFDCDFTACLGGSHLTTTGGSIIFSHCCYSDTAQNSSNCNILYTSQSASSIKFENCAFDYCTISLSDWSSITSFSNCIYSDNVADRATYTWSASKNTDPLLVWYAAGHYWVASLSSPLFNKGSDGLDVGNLNNCVIKIGN